MRTPFSRRTFLTATGAVAATPAVAAPSAAAEPGRSTLPYPRHRIAHLSALAIDVPVHFTFPDPSSACVVVKLAGPVPVGAGPLRDLVAFSVACPHMGCPVEYDATRRLFRCHCHFSMFDAERGGQLIIGQATEGLPRVTLEVDAAGDIFATGVEGLLYGRQSNLLERPR